MAATGKDAAMNCSECSAMEALLARPASEFFWASQEADGTFATGNTQSLYQAVGVDKYLSFDITNNMMLTHVGFDGSLKQVTSYRGCYPLDSRMAGVWWHKTLAQSGPYSYLIELAGERIELSSVDWSRKMTLLGNVVPVLTFTGPGVEITLVTFAPVSADGIARPRAMVYGLHLRNTSAVAVSVKVHLPASSPHTLVTVLDDCQATGRAVAFDLAAGESAWVPTVIAAVPGADELAALSSRTASQWLDETLAYFASITGKIVMPEDPFLGEFLQRCMLQGVSAMAMDVGGDLVGANWSGFPATEQVWMKDMFYSLLPLVTHEPELAKKGILWFMDRSVRFAGDKDYEGYPLAGGVSHSLSNTLTPVVLAGLYYKVTGDRAFFDAHPEVLETSKQLLAEVLATREGEVWLFPSMWLSDGLSRGDYHTGSNIIAQVAFDTMAAVLDEVAGEAALAAEYRDVAARIRHAIDEVCITDGPMGPQYVEGAFADGSFEVDHDGEETDTTLMPFYGLLGSDNEAYLNCMRVALTDANRHYRASTRTIKDSTWLKDPDPPIDATIPGYMTGLAGAYTEADLTGPEGRLTIIRELTDVDGSMWWWPYHGTDVIRAYEIDGGFVGKSGWGPAVFVCHVVSQLLGLSYDGRARRLRFAPISPTTNFGWRKFRLGGGVFSVEYVGKDTPYVRYRVDNHNDFPITLDLTMRFAPNATLESMLVDGQLYYDPVVMGTSHGATTATITVTLEPNSMSVLEAGYDAPGDDT